MPRTLSLPFFFFSSYGDHRDLHSFPTRRSSDLRSLFLVSGTNGKTTTTALLAAALGTAGPIVHNTTGDRKSTRLNSSHRCISYAVFCLKKKRQQNAK